MVSGSAIATLVVFILSIICVIRPFSFPIFIPYLGFKRVPINLTTAPIIAILVLWAAQCLGPHEIRDGIVGTAGVKPYNILILFFSLAYMAITLDISGILQAAAFWVSNKGGTSGRKLFLYFYLLLTVISVLLGNDPVILTGTVFLVYYTRVTELNPIAWLISEFAAANTASMVLFVGNPTNVVICEGFAVNNAGFTGYTILPFLACSFTCFIALAIQFRHVKYIPRKLNVSGDLDVRAVLIDPIGAIVGGGLFAIFLVVVIVVGFLKIDVWKVSLPFAVAKFLWDLAWDTCRTRYGKLQVEEEAKNEDSNTDEEDNDVMLRQLKQRKAHSTINTEESELKPKPEGGVANGVASGTANGHEDAVPNTAEPIDMLSKSNTIVTFDEPLPISSPPGVSRSDTLKTVQSQQSSSSKSKSKPFSSLPVLSSIFRLQRRFSAYLSIYYPTFHTALPRLPFALVPFAFSQFILIEGLSRQGWIDIFARWLVIVTKRELFKTIWVVGVLGVLLCNTSGTNIGATILLTKIVNTAASSYVPPSSGPEVDIKAFLRSAAIALAVASNIGAVSFTFSASLAGLLWRQILSQKKIIVTQITFAKWNLGPIVVMTAVGLAVVSAEMAILY